MTVEHPQLDEVHVPLEQLSGKDGKRYFSDAEVELIKKVNFIHDLAGLYSEAGLWNPDEMSIQKDDSLWLKTRLQALVDNFPIVHHLAQTQDNLTDLGWNLSEPLSFHRGKITEARGRPSERSGRE